MREQRNELDHGLVEIRTYDDDGKLVNIHKKYPADISIRPVSSIPRLGGFGRELARD